MKNGEKQRRGIAPGAALWVALLLALLLHLLVVPPFLSFVISTAPSSPYRVVNIDLLSDSATNKENEKKTPEEQLEEYQPREEIPDGQVVRVQPTKDKRPPKETPRFLAEQDSNASRETQSRIRLPGVSGTAPSPELRGQGADSQTIQGGMRADEAGVGPLPADLPRTQKGELSGEKRAPLSLFDINLQPSREAMTRTLAGSGLDHLEDVAVGDATALNAVSWKYASFFNRVKEKVEQYWHPDVEYQKHDPYGSIYGQKDRITVLLVVLRPDGGLKNLYVMDPSGAPFLDDEAWEAVEQAAPYPNVPEGLMDEDDRLVKFTFHFLVEVGEAPAFRVRRYP